MDSPWLDIIKEKGAALWLRLSDSWQHFREEMRHKHRLVLMDTDNFKEKFSLELTGTNLFTIIGCSLVVLIMLAMLLVAFTPLRNLVPGYIKPAQRQEIMRNTQKIDSLENLVEQHEQLIATMQDVLSGKNMSAKQQEQVAQLSEEAVVYRHSKEDSLLRRDIEQKHKAAKKKSKKKSKK